MHNYVFYCDFGRCDLELKDGGRGRSLDSYTAPACQYALRPLLFSATFHPHSIYTFVYCENNHRTGRCDFGEGDLSRKCSFQWNMIWKGARTSAKNLGIYKDLGAFTYEYKELLWDAFWKSPEVVQEWKMCHFSVESNLQGLNALSLSSMSNYSSVSKNLFVGIHWW